MTKKYQNRTSMMRSITFVDGSSQFLMRGQSIVTDKPVVNVQPGIIVKEVKSTAEVKKVAMNRPRGAIRRSIRRPSEHAIRRMKQKQEEEKRVDAIEAKREEVKQEEAVAKAVAEEVKQEEAVAEEVKQEEAEKAVAEEAKPVKRTRAKQKPVEEVKGEDSEK